MNNDWKKTPEKRVLFCENTCKTRADNVKVTSTATQPQKYAINTSCIVLKSADQSY